MWRSFHFLRNLPLIGILFKWIFFGNFYFFFNYLNFLFKFLRFFVLVKKRNFGQKAKFWSKSEILVKNRNFGQTATFWSKIEILVKNLLVVLWNFFPRILSVFGIFSNGFMFHFFNYLNVLFKLLRFFAKF